jgi:hypothetical protein
VLPKLAALRAVAALLGEFAVAGCLRQMIILTKMVHETRRLVAGHWFFQSPPLGQRVTRHQPAVKRRPSFIDPKYDTCTKPRGLSAFEKFFSRTSSIQPVIGTANLLLSYFTAT